MKRRSCPRAFCLGILGIASAHLVWLSGCRVGNPVVDDRNGGLGAIQCSAPPADCEPLRHPSLEALSSAPAVPVSCAEVPACTASTAEAEAEAADAATGDPGAQGSVIAAAVSSALAVAPECQDQLTVEALPAVAECASQRLRVPAGVSQLRLDALQWRAYDLWIESQSALRVELYGASLQQVFVGLRGPIELVVSRASQLQDLRIQAAATPAGRPRVAIDNSTAVELSVTGDVQSELDLQTVEAVDSELVIGSADIESTRLMTSSLRADTLILTDVSLDIVAVDAVSATVSAFDTQGSRLRFCGASTLIEGIVSRSTLSVCEGETLRLYSVSSAQSAIDGHIEADTSSLEGVKLGGSAATRITSYQSTFQSILLCEQVQWLALDAGSGVRCSKCKDAVLELPEPVCSLAKEPATLESNACDVLIDQPPPPVCDATFPRRTRPRS